MSGGHWHYGGYKIKDAMQEISEDPIVKERWPTLGQLLGVLGERLYEIDHEMDWDISGDSSIPDDAAFEKKQIGALLDAVLKASPDEWFPRGKWATIQALQERSKSVEGGE